MCLNAIDMTVKAFIFLIFLSTGTSIRFSETRFLRKCCPSGEVFSLSKVDCIPAPMSSITLHVADEGSIAMENDGFPNCSEPEDVTTTALEKFTATDYLNTPACLEILSEDSMPFIVHCQSNKDRVENNETSSVSLARVANIRRCCPQNMIYDERKKYCIRDVENSTDRDSLTDDDFISLLPSSKGMIDFFIFTRGPPACSDAVAAVAEFEIDVKDLFFENQTLRVKIPWSERGLGKETISFMEKEGCLDSVVGTSRRRLIVRACGDAKYCSDKSCVRKCCPEGKAHFAKKGCRDISEAPVPIQFQEALENYTNEKGSSVDYNILLGDPCVHGKYSVDSSEGWYLTERGRPYVPNYKLYEDHEYCIDILYNSSSYEDGIYPFVCFDPPEDEEEGSLSRIRVGINTVLQITSCFFLFLTLLVYACLPILQNLHGKTLMCHVASLLLAYACLTTMAFATPDAPFYVPFDITAVSVLCKSLGYTMLFSFLSAFSWLNIMCFDIWWTFG